MITFLPYANFEDCATCLDRKRLGAMRRESKQCLSTLLGLPTVKGTPRVGYMHHPVLNWWRGYEDALRAYFNAMNDEWIARGYKSNIDNYPVPDRFDLPPWWADSRFHSRHRSQLYHKNPEHYSQFNWIEANEPLKPYDWRPANV